MIKETKKAPTIRFRDFTDDWEQRKLEDFGRATGGTSIESEFNKEGKYKVISIGSYSENSTYTDQGIRCNLTEKTQNRILNKNDLTMILNDKTAVGRIIGRVLLIEQDNSYVYNQRTERIEPNKNKYDPLFLYEMLNAPGIRSKIVRQCQGNTQIYVNWPVIANQKYKIPELKEQKIIGFFLKDLDHLITLHQRKLDQLKTLKKYFLQNMFPAKGEKVPRIRFKGFTGDWEQRKLFDCIEKITDFRGRTPKKLGMDWSNEGFLALSALNVKNGYIDFSQDVHYGDQRLYDKWMAGNELHEGQVLFTTEAPMGNVAQVPDNRSYILSQRTIAFTVNPDVLDENFLAISLRTPRTQDELDALQSGGTAKGVSKKSLSVLNITMPTKLNEQQRIAKTFNDFDHLITLHQRKLNQLQTMKKFMLQNLFI